MPFSFRVYAILEVSSRLADKDVHELIDMLAPNLRSQEQEGDRIIRKREFYNMPAEDAFKILNLISKINGAKLPELCKQTKEEVKDEIIAEEARKNLHHFDTVVFKSSITGQEYKTGMEKNGTLTLIETATNVQLQNYSNPSKKQIIRQALLDLGENVDNHQTLYQLAHKLIKIIKTS